MTNSAKRSALTFLLFTVLITALLAVALPRLELQKGILLPGITTSTGKMPETQYISISISISTFIKVVISLLFILMLIYLAFRLRLKPNWKEIAKAFLLITILALVLTAILYALVQGYIPQTSMEVKVLPVELNQVGPALELVPSYLLWIVWVGLAGGVLFLVFSFLRYRNRARILSDPLVLEAEQAMQALKTGQDLKSVIIHCYTQMSLILQKEQRVVRAETMTAREFEALLKIRGVPDIPVHQLTQLFEIGRYSALLPGLDAEQQAIDSLNSIIQFSRKLEPGLPK